MAEKEHRLYAIFLTHGPPVQLVSDQDIVRVIDKQMHDIWKSKQWGVPVSIKDDKDPDVTVAIFAYHSIVAVIQGEIAVPTKKEAG